MNKLEKNYKTTKKGGNPALKKGGPSLNPNGRPKGSKNKFTTLKEAFINAFVGSGGEEALTEFAKQARNKKEFYKMIAKMLPNSVDIEVKHDLGEKLDAAIRRAQGKKT